MCRMVREKRQRQICMNFGCAYVRHAGPRKRAWVVRGRCNFRAPATRSSHFGRGRFVLFFSFAISAEAASGSWVVFSRWSIGPPSSERTGKTALLETRFQSCDRRNLCVCVCVIPDYISGFPKLKLNFDLPARAYPVVVHFVSAMAKLLKGCAASTRTCSSCSLYTQTTGLRWKYRWGTQHVCNAYHS